MMTNEETIARTLAGIEKALSSIERRPLMFAIHAYAIEGLVLHFVATRQALRGYDEFDVGGALQHFLFLLCGRNHPCGLVGLLRDHGMLGRGRRDQFGDLPRLLGDFARWADRRWPARGAL